MAYVRVRTSKDGTPRYVARYLGADGKYHEEGSFLNRRDAVKAAASQEVDAARGDWTSAVAGRVNFAEFVARTYWPTTEHLEVSTRAAYRYNLDRHFLPRFGSVQLRKISPELVQSWVNDATCSGLSPRTVVKCHALLHRIFNRAIVARAVIANPCAYTELPKVIIKPKQIITVETFDAILAGVPAKYRMMVVLAIETGVRWGELIALRPVDIDFARHIVNIQRTIVEVARKNSPTGERCFVKEYPKDDEPRTIQIEAATCGMLTTHIAENQISDVGLLFTSLANTPISRNNFRTKYWRPAVVAARTSQSVTFHNLRAAHASWLLAGGADLQIVKERLGHAQISTTQQYLGTLPDAGDRALAAFRRIRHPS
jgi:integrase